HCSRVAVINRAAQKHARPCPRLAIVTRSHRLNLAKGTHMGLASARPRHPQLAIGPSRDCRPAMIMLLVWADDFDVSDFRTGSCLEQPRTTNKCSGGYQAGASQEVTA